MKPSTWSMIYRGGPGPLHVHIPTMLESFDQTEVILARFIDTNFSYKTWTSHDQTFTESDGVECFNEIVLRRQ